LGVQFAAVFAGQLPGNLLGVEWIYHGTPLTRGIVRELPLEPQQPLDAEKVRQLALQSTADLVLSIESIVLEESLLEEIAGSEAVRGGTSVTYELRSIKTSKVQSRLGVRVYDGTSGLPIDGGEYASVNRNKYREPIGCEKLLSGESYQAIADCFKQLVNNMVLANKP
jgi:hypothetical protein